MHHFIFPSQDTWISSGSSTIDGESFKDQNFGRDQILEVKKEFFNNSFDHQTRALVNFSGTEFTELSKSVSDGTIASDAKYFLAINCWKKLPFRVANYLGLNIVKNSP